MDEMEKKEWYQDVSLEDAKLFIKSNISSAARSFIAVGYYLKCIRDKELFSEDGYPTIWDFAAGEYGLSKSTASRYMAMNDKFSQNGNSPLIRDEYKEFGKSQLQEMLYLTDEQMEQVAPDTMVKEIREIRRETIAPYTGPQVEGQMEIENFPEYMPDGYLAGGLGGAGYQNAPIGKVTAEISIEDMIGTQEEVGTVAISQQEELSAFGTPKMVRPKDSLITTPGCEGGHDCFSCHMECGIRQKYCYCVEAPMGNPFPCSILEQMGDLKKDLGERCQFVNHDLAHHRSGDQEPVPCCKKCQEPCSYACERSRKEEVVQEPAIAQESEMQEEDEELCPPNNYGCRRQEWGSDGESQKRGKEECRKCWADAMKLQTVVGRVEELPVVAEEAVFEPDDIEPETVINTDYTEVQESVVESLEHEEQSEEEYNLEYVLHQQKSKLDRLLWAVKGKKQSEADNEIIECQKVIVYALENLKEPANTEPSKEPEPVEQPDLPLLKNNDQRAAFVDAYETWPLWIETVETGERYYRYDLSDGTSMVVKVYHAMLFRFIAGAERWEDQYREGYGKEEYYLLQDGKFFRDCDTNRSALIDKLKEIQKGKKDEKT